MIVLNTCNTNKHFQEPCTDTRTFHWCAPLIFLAFWAALGVSLFWEVLGSAHIGRGGVWCSQCRGHRNISDSSCQTYTTIGWPVTSPTDDPMDIGDHSCFTWMWHRYSYPVGGTDLHLDYSFMTILIAWCYCFPLLIRNFPRDNQLPSLLWIYVNCVSWWVGVTLWRPSSVGSEVRESTDVRYGDGNWFAVSSRLTSGIPLAKG